MTAPALGDLGYDLTRALHEVSGSGGDRAYLVRSVGTGVYEVAAKDIDSLAETIFTVRISVAAVTA